MKVKKYHIASSLEEAYSLLNEDPKNMILGGGLWIKKLDLNINTLIDLSKLGLEGIKEEGDSLLIGALTTLRDIEKSKDVMNIANGIVNKAITQIMGPAFRNQATIGGSIVGKYGFSDVITPLLCLDVTLHFYPNEKMSLSEFLSLKGRNNKILTHIKIKHEVGKSYFKKVKANAIDFAMLNLAIVRIDDNYRVSVGSRPGVALIPKEALKMIDNESVLTDLEISQFIDKAMEEIAMGDSVSCSLDYRKVLLKTYLRRGLKEVC